jgi:cytochrome P450
MDINLAVRPGEGLPLEEFARIRAKGPVFWSETLGGWVVCGYPEVRSALSNRIIFTSEGTPIAEAFGAEAMLTNDTGLHNRMRAVWAPALSVGGVMAHDAEVRRVAARLLAAMGERLRRGEAVDLVEVLQDFTAELIIWLMDFPRWISNRIRRNIAGIWR